MATAHRRTGGGLTQAQVVNSNSTSRVKETPLTALKYVQDINNGLHGLSWLIVLEPRSRKRIIHLRKRSDLLVANHK